MMNALQMRAKMTAKQSQTMDEMDATLTEKAGFECSLTIRGLKCFTVTADGVADFSNLIEWLKSENSRYEVITEVEINRAVGMSFLYFDLE